MYYPNFYENVSNSTTTVYDSNVNSNNVSVNVNSNDVNVSNENSNMNTASLQTLKKNVWIGML